MDGRIVASRMSEDSPGDQRRRWRRNPACPPCATPLLAPLSYPRCMHGMVWSSSLSSIGKYYLRLLFCIALPSCYLIRCLLVTLHNGSGTFYGAGKRPEYGASCEAWGRDSAQAGLCRTRLEPPRLLSHKGLLMYLGT